MLRIPTFSELGFRAKTFWSRSLANKLIAVCSLVFLAETSGLFFANAFALNVVWIRDGFFLNFLTYGFLHGGFWHVVLNMIALYFCGNAIEKYDARGNVLAVFLGGILAGGFAWFGLVRALAAHPEMQTLVGASSGIAALFAYFSIANRDAEIRALLFFVVPVQMRAWLLFAGLAAISAFGLVFWEIPSMRGGNAQAAMQTIAHSAHVGGLIFGAFYALATEKFRSRFSNLRYFRR